MIARKLIKLPRVGCQAGFTLVEILVAIVVLAIITLIMASIFSNTSSIVSQSNSTMGALDAGEAVLAQIGLDISRMVLRDDIDYDFTKQAGDDRLSFYARTSGFDATGNSATSPRPLAVVGYQVGTNPGNPTSSARQLNYGGLQIDWATGGSSPFTLTKFVSGAQTQNLVGGDLPLPTAYTTLAQEVIRFEYSFLLKTDPVAADVPPKLLTSTVPAGLNGQPAIESVAGILVAIVVVDQRSRLLFPAGSDVSLAAKFPDSVSNQDILTSWSSVLTPATLKTVNIPAQALEGIRIYQRYYPFPW